MIFRSSLYLANFFHPHEYLPNTKSTATNQCTELLSPAEDFQAARLTQVSCVLPKFR